MKFTSNYLHDEFSGKSLFMKLRDWLFWPVSTIVMIALCVNLIHHADNHTKGMMRVIDGISRMSPTDFMWGGIVGVALTIANVFLFQPLLYKSQKMIVYLSFDDHAQVLEIITKHILTNVSQKTQIPYAQLKLLHNNAMNDGLRFFKQYDGYKIKKENEILGMIMEKHFIWDIEDYNNIKSKLLAVES